MTSLAHKQSRRKWVPVTSASPCPICRHDSWCQLAADGTTAMCMRADDGRGTRHEDTNGVAFWMCPLPKPVAVQPVQADSSAPEGVEPADPDTLHRVYSALLEQLSLSAEHCEALGKRGLAVSGNGNPYGYRTLGNSCSSISDQLASFRDQTLIMPKRSLLEGAMLLRYSTEG